LPLAHETTVPDDDLLAFIATSVSSVWALELLLLLKRNPEKAWNAERLVRELRSSQVVVDEAIKRLQHAGLVMHDEAGTYRYRTASAHLDRLVSELEEAYAAKPMMVINAIVAAPSDKLRAFSDAFKLKE
jgi:hypothetical protein